MCGTNNKAQQNLLLRHRDPRGPRLPGFLRPSALYKGLAETRSKEPTGELPGTHRPSRLDVIHCADARDMHHLPDNSVHLMITSPPYNVGKDYDDDLSLSEYRGLLTGVLQETYRTLVQGGRACVNIANVGRTPYIPLHVYIMDIAREWRVSDARRDHLGQGRKRRHVMRMGQLEVGEQSGLARRPRIHPGLLQGCVQASGDGGE